MDRKTILKLHFFFKSANNYGLSISIRFKGKPYAVLFLPRQRGNACHLAYYIHQVAASGHYDLCIVLQ